MAEVFGGKVPDSDTLEAQLSFLIKYWKNRNLFIRDMRRAQNGLNDIEAPKSTMYVVKVLHTYILAALMNEKTSRYLPRPVVQILPNDPLSDEDRAKSSRGEVALNVAGYEVERRSGGDTWDRAVLDSILLDMGVQKIVRDSAGYWSEITQRDARILEKQEKGEEYDADDLKYDMGSKEREDYKRAQGIPINKFYVPLEYFYPYYDGHDMPFSFEVSETTIYSVLDNPRYKNEFGEETLKNLTPGPDGGLNETVHVIEFANNRCHAYFLGGPGANSGNNKYPKLTVNSAQFSGRLQPLYYNEHEIERSIYNTIGGRYGGWKTSHNRIESVGKGILELSQAADEIVSQVLTNVRAKYWPSLNFKMDPEVRGFGVGNSKPAPPTIREGESIVSFIGEEILPIFKPEDDPMVMWLYDQIQMQISKLGGSAVLYGQRAPGVDTGYNQAIQQTQAESLDNKQEQHIQAGAEEEALIITLHARKIGEPIELVYLEQDKSTKKKTAKNIKLDPEDFTPIPRFAAQVRKQRPVDYIGALRAFQMATDDRQGKGPALSDDTAREELLGTVAPDVEYKKILKEALRREIVQTGVISSKVGDQINIKLAKLGTPAVGPEAMAKADPALLAAIQQIQPAAVEQGGTSPGFLGDMAEAAGLPPGPVPGDSGITNRVGEAIEGNVQTGAASI